MQSLLLLTPLLAAAPAEPADGGLLALRVGRAETVANGTVEHAVVLIEDGKIVSVGEDMPVERGIPVLDRPDWVVVPGFVHARSRIGLDSKAGGNSSNPQKRASAELYHRQDEWDECLERGVTTLGLHPAGGGIPGQAVAVRPKGANGEAMVLKDPAYLLVYVGADSRLKKNLVSGFEKADKHLEKVEKEREKWEKAQERKKKKSKTKKKDDEEDEEEKEEDDDTPDEFVPPEPDEDVKPFLDLRDGTLAAMMSIGKAADFLHLLDALGEEEITWSVHAPLRDDVDLYEVADRVAEKGARIVLEPKITLQPYTRRDRNIPAEMAKAGAKLALVPSSDSVSGLDAWRHDVGVLVRYGLDPEVALRAMTLEAAEVLGLADRVGSIEPGKDANLVLLDGPPFESSTRVRMVLLEGEVVHEDRPFDHGGTR